MLQGKKENGKGVAIKKKTPKQPSVPILTREKKRSSQLSRSKRTIPMGINKEIL